VIINRDGIGDNRVETYLKNKPYPILMKIPYQNEIARGLAAGKILIDFIPTYRQKFINLFQQITTILESKVEGTC
jgi:MinD superfamily P-loop ATPase